MHAIFLTEYKSIVIIFLSEYFYMEVIFKLKTTVVLDEELLGKATEIFQGKTRKEIISIALAELVARHEQKDLYDLFDSDEQLIADDYDYKAMRGGALYDLS